jgi:hypothetical protein
MSDMQLKQAFLMASETSWAPEETPIKTKPSGFRLEPERGPIDAVAQARGLRTVGKDVTEMGFAPRAPYFGPAHQERGVLMLANRILAHWPRVARPPGP